MTNVRNVDSILSSASNFHISTLSLTNFDVALESEYSEAWLDAIMHQALYLYAGMGMTINGTFFYLPTLLGQTIGT